MFEELRTCCGTSEVRSGRVINGNYVIKCVSCGNVGVGLSVTEAVDSFNKNIKENKDE